MNRFIISLFLLSAFTKSFAQFTDTAQLNNYIRENIRDKRPEKVTAEQIQKALLGTSYFLKSGTLTSVGLSMPPGHFIVTNNPIISDGTINITWNPVSTRTFLAGATLGGTSGLPVFRAIQETDISALAKNTLIGRYSPSTGEGQQITVGSGLTLNNTTGLLTATGSGGTVTSVGIAAPTSIFSNSPAVTSSGTLGIGLLSQTANMVFAGPSSGASSIPGFRNLLTADIPDLSTLKIASGIFSIARGGTGLGTVGTPKQLLRVNSAANGLEYFTPAAQDFTNIVAITDDYVIRSNDLTIINRAAGETTPTITLPEASSSAGRILVLFEDSDNTASYMNWSQRVYQYTGGPQFTNFNNAILSPYRKITIQSDGINWFIIGVSL